MLEVSSLNVFYGESHIVRDATFSLGAGEALAVMGRNGMGKTTLLKALIGMLRSTTGSIRLEDRELAGTHSYERVARGLAFVPQGRMIFPLLTVEENILAGMTSSRERAVPEYVYRFFPVLRSMHKRRGGNLSGGQQQMLAISRALVSNPKVLILDEPTDPAVDHQGDRAHLDRASPGTRLLDPRLGTGSQLCERRGRPVPGRRPRSHRAGRAQGGPGRRPDPFVPDGVNVCGTRWLALPRVGNSATQPQGCRHAVG